MSRIRLVSLTSMSCGDTGIGLRRTGCCGNHGMGIVGWNRRVSIPHSAVRVPKLVEIKDCGKACVRGFGGLFPRGRNTMTTSTCLSRIGTSLRRYNQVSLQACQLCFFQRLERLTGLKVSMAAWYLPIDVKHRRIVLCSLLF